MDFSPLHFIKFSVVFFGYVIILLLFVYSIGYVVSNFVENSNKPIAVRFASLLLAIALMIIAAMILVTGFYIDTFI